MIDNHVPEDPLGLMVSGGGKIFRRSMLIFKDPPTFPLPINSSTLSYKTILSLLINLKAGISWFWGFLFFDFYIAPVHNGTGGDGRVRRWRVRAAISG